MKLSNIIIAVAATVLATSCGSKKDPQYIIVEPEKPAVKKQTTIASEPYKMEDNISWFGSMYKYRVVRESDKEAPTVKNEDGQKFFDNKATVTVWRADGSEFYSHTFKKESFSQYLPSLFNKNGILEGLVFEKAEKEYLQFAASVALPQTDEYMPFAIRISTSGSITIVKVNEMEEAQE